MPARGEAASVVKHLGNDPGSVMPTVLPRNARHLLKKACQATVLFLVLCGVARANDESGIRSRTNPILPPVMVPGPMVWGFVIWPSRLCPQTRSYPSDRELTLDILKNLEKQYPDYFVMKSKKTVEDLLTSFPDCCSIKPAPYLVRLLTDTRVEYHFNFYYSKYDRDLPNAELLGEATACGRLGISRRMLDCLEGNVVGANSCSSSKWK